MINMHFFQNQRIEKTAPILTLSFWYCHLASLYIFLSLIFLAHVACTVVTVRAQRKRRGLAGLKESLSLLEAQLLNLLKASKVKVATGNFLHWARKLQAQDSRSSKEKFICAQVF